MCFVMICNCTRSYTDLQKMQCSELNNVKVMKTEETRLCVWTGIMTENWDMCVSVLMLDDDLFIVPLITIIFFYRIAHGCRTRIRW